MNTHAYIQKFFVIHGVQFYKDTLELFTESEIWGSAKGHNKVSWYLNQYWKIIAEMCSFVEPYSNVYSRLEKCFIIQLIFKKEFGTFWYYMKKYEFAGAEFVDLSDKIE